MSSPTGSMKTIVLNNPGHFELISTDPPTKQPGQAIVRVHRIGICGTDLHAFRGRQPFFSYPRILGHELGVEILEIDANDFGLKVGDRCAVEPYLNCGNCVACRRGKTNCCTSLKCLGVHTDGGMRERIAVPIHKLHKSDELSLDQLALVETLGIGAHAVARANLDAGEFALVVGAGPIGLSVLQFLKPAGAVPIVIDVNQKRLDFCRRTLDVEHCIDASSDVVLQLKHITGDQPTAVFDATGNAQSMMKSFSYAANGGKLIFVGLVQADITFNDPEFHRKEITLFATRNSTAGDFKRIIQLIEQRQIDTTPWITHRARFDDMIGQFESWTDPNNGVIKAIVSP
jgi:2-desacetyl-2-hydroxyethyl bacteriochlorophyllide A dehydrogenase